MDSIKVLDGVVIDVHITGRIIFIQSRLPFLKGNLDFLLKQKIVNIWKK